MDMRAARATLSAPLWNAPPRRRSTRRSAKSKTSEAATRKTSPCSRKWPSTPAGQSLRGLRPAAVRGVAAHEGPRLWEINQCVALKEHATSPSFTYSTPIGRDCVARWRGGPDSARTRRNFDFHTGTRPRNARGRKASVENVARARDVAAFQYFHAWEAGDVVVWDNSQTLHQSMPYDNDGHARREYYRSQARIRPPAVAEL